MSNVFAYQIGNYPIGGVRGPQKGVNAGGIGEIQTDPDMFQMFLKMMRRAAGANQQMGNYASDGGVNNGGGYAGR